MTTPPCRSRSPSAPRSACRSSRHRYSRRSARSSGTSGWLRMRATSCATLSSWILIVCHLMKWPAAQPPPCCGFDHLRVAVERGGRETVRPSRSRHHLVAEQLHAAIGVMDDEPFLCAEQLVRNDERANRIVGGAPAGVADHMRVAFRQAGVFRRIEARVHAGEDGEAPRRRQREIALVAEVRDIGGVGRRHFIDDCLLISSPLLRIGD